MSIRTCKLYLLSFCLGIPLSIYGEVKLPRVISDGMVLQQGVPANIWGFANPKETIKVVFEGNVISTMADQSGQWSVELPSMPAGGPYSITVNDKIIKDVLFGEVWVCSGQSNMESSMKTFGDGLDKESESDFPMIRHFNAPQIWNIDGPEEDLPSGQWKAATKGNFDDASATAYFFSKEMHNAYGVPVGIINVSVGGSPLEAWLSQEAASNYDDLKVELRLLHDKAHQDSLSSMQQELLSRFTNDSGNHPKSLLSDVMNGTYKDWGEIYMPGIFSDKGIDFNRGIIWLNKSINISASLDGKPGVLKMGIVDDTDSTYVNGVFVGTNFSNMLERYYHIPSGILKTGENNITVALKSNSKGGFLTDRPYSLSVGDSCYNLSGYWHYTIAADDPKGNEPEGQEWMWMFMPGMPGKMSPTGLYNAMVAPVTPYRIKGVLWYQGESNSMNWQNYEDRLKTLISDWREKFNSPDLPWITIQLPEFGSPNIYDENNSWAHIRDAQRRSLSLPNTGLAVTLGFGEWNCIHPGNKTDVGYNAFQQSRKVAYHEDNVVGGGPIPVKATSCGDSILLSFDQVGKGIDPNVLNLAFYIAGSDGNYGQAQCSVISHDKIRLYSPLVKNPISIRYAWADNPEHATLKNFDGFTAGSFEIEINE